MTFNNKNIWSWIKTKGNILKIVSNPNKGTIKVYNEKGKMIIKKTDLTKEQVKIMEESFIEHIAIKLNKLNHKKKEKYDPMIT